MSKVDAGRRTRRTLLITVAITSVTIVTATPGVEAARSAGGTCLGDATVEVAVAPGSLTSTRHISITYVGHDAPCHMSDPTISSAVEHGSGTGTFNCSQLGGVEQGTDVYTWSNGRTSVLSYRDSVLAGVSNTTGTIIRGEFRGLRVNYFGLGLPSPQICTSARGGTFPGFFEGAGRFGMN
jgi:hypothetical protein